MYLWQIRQFPNERQNQFIRNFFCSLFILCIPLISPVALTAQSDASPNGDDSDSEEDSSAQVYFEKAIKTLTTHQTIQAKLVEQVTINDQPLRLTGRYVGKDNRLRLELAVKLTGDVEGSLLEVSDGEILWNQTEIDETRRVTFRNLKQIAAAYVKQPSAGSASWDVELGLGGITGLMNSLQRTMQFDQLREESQGDVRFVIVQGKWKSEFTKKWQPKKDQPLPTYIPEMLRIYFNAETLFPQRFLYLKKNPEKEMYRPLVRLEFQDVQLNAAVETSEFQFTPPEDLVPEDVTQQYLDQLTRKNAPASDPAKLPPGIPKPK